MRLASRRTRRRLGQVMTVALVASFAIGLVVRQRTPVRRVPEPPPVARPSRPMPRPLTNVTPIAQSPPLDAVAAESPPEERMRRAAEAWAPPRPRTRRAPAEVGGADPGAADAAVAADAVGPDPEADEPAPAGGTHAGLAAASGGGTLGRAPWDPAGRRAGTTGEAPQRLGPGSRPQGIWERRARDRAEAMERWEPVPTSPDPTPLPRQTTPPLASADPWRTLPSPSERPPLFVDPRR